mgnify:FL=1
MTQYVVVFLAIFVANSVPAFAPPTWMFLVYFELQYTLHPVLLVITGALAATSGRAVIATYMRALTPWLPTKYVANMESAGRYFTRTKAIAYTAIMVFFFSPLSSAQLFAAAGIMRNVALRPLLTAFFFGKLMSYSIYVFGAHTLKTTDFGQLVVEQMTSPLGIAVQILLVLAVVALGLRDWNHLGTRGESPKE